MGEKNDLSASRMREPIHADGTFRKSRNLKAEIEPNREVVQQCAGANTEQNKIMIMSKIMSKKCGQLCATGAAQRARWITAAGKTPESGCGFSLQGVDGEMLMRQECPEIPRRAGGGEKRTLLRPSTAEGGATHF